MELYERLKIIFKNMKQNEIAKSLNISQGAISSILKGQKTPSYETLEKICRLYQIDGTWLLTGEQSKNQDYQDYRYKYLDERDKEQIEYILDQAESRSKEYDKVGNL